ncbi:flavodoxin family protein [Methanospirillum stamsii]|uniref:ArsR family transcriptional regulator n=1 Tax=Methanospirillum stamsii TaxID=1277351 RepID=A0A2V2N8S1_9EURY|nr:flavodoxin [Methanospirillum stamsii]PWR76314.1 ArsR family transcriptional regulator [Methanospirillum stamsii]
MKTIIIYHSYSGITKAVVEKIKSILSADSIEIVPKHPYSSLMVYPKGCYRAMKGEVDEVTPEKIDVSGYDMVVMASPVWAGKPTPVINGAIRALNGCKGSQAFLFLTCGAKNSGLEAVSSFRERMNDMGLQVSGDAVLDKKDVQNPEMIENLSSLIRSAGEKT